MKITKSQLNQIIKEELEKSLTSEMNEEWLAEMEQVVLSAHNLFKRLPQEAKPHLIQNFEMYVKLWKDEDNNVEDLDFDSHGGL